MMDDRLTIDVEDLLAEIDLATFPSARGRKPKEVMTPLLVGRARELTAEDVLVARTTAPDMPTSVPPSLVRLRTRHHRLAQLLSTGISDAKIALATGYSQSRISVLKNDPSFKELVAHYSKENAAVDVEIRNRIEMLSMEAVEIIQDRLEDNSDEFSNKELMDLAEMTLDRTGFGKSSTVSVLHGLDNETIALIQAQKEASQQGQILNLSEGEFIDLPGDNPLTPIASEKIQSRLEEDKRSLRDQGCDLSAEQTGLYTDTAAEKWLNDRQRAGVPAQVDNPNQGGDVVELRPSTIRGSEGTKD